MGLLVSILINNWNYAGYVGQAIESALAQTHPEVEVVVVDDGSTDDSRDVLERYAGQVTLIMQERGGQPAAAAAGLAASHGDIVMFLDADDFLEPEAAARVSAVWTSDCAKAQFRLSLVDAAGRRIGADPPLHVPLPNGDVVPEIVTRGGYETPVTSGNAYPRQLLEHLFPVPPEFRYFDPYLNTVAPFYGRVVSIDAELGAYRLHSRNGWALTDRVDLERIRERLREDLIKERYIERAAAATGRDVPPGTALRKPVHVLHRLASLRLEPSSHPVAGDDRRRLLRAGIRALRSDRGRPLPDKLFDAGLLLFTAAAPRRMAQSAVEFALLSRPRPAWLRATARAVRHGAAAAGARGSLRVAYRALDQTPAARLLRLPVVERARRRLTATRLGAADVPRIVGVLSDAGIQAWLAGGWACDALLAEQTRPHGDLDLVIAETDRQPACEALARHGFVLTEEFAAGLMRTALELLDRRGRRKVALHPVDITSDGAAAWPVSLRRRMLDLGLDPAEIFITANVAGHRLPCLSAPALVALHTGYQPRDADRRDVCALCTRFSLPVPAGYKCPERGG